MQGDIITFNNTIMDPEVEQPRRRILPTIIHSLILTVFFLFVLAYYSVPFLAYLISTSKDIVGQSAIIGVGSLLNIVNSSLWLAGYENILLPLLAFLTELGVQGYRKYKKKDFDSLFITIAVISVVWNALLVAAVLFKPLAPVFIPIESPELEEEVEVENEVENENEPSAEQTTAKRSERV